MTTPRRQKLRGFTLIELLVVVAIVSMLVAVLLPSLARARDQSKTLSCLSNLRSVMQVQSLYAQENDNYIPPSTWPNATLPLTPGVAPSPSGVAKSGYAYILSAYIQGVSANNLGTTSTAPDNIFKTQVQVKLFLCPSATITPPPTGDSTVAGAFRWDVFHYQQNRVAAPALGTDSPALVYAIAPHRTVECSRPQDVAAWMDATQWDTSKGNFGAKAAMGNTWNVLDFARWYTASNPGTPTSTYSLTYKPNEFIFNEELPNDGSTGNIDDGVNLSGQKRNGVRWRHNIVGINNTNSTKTMGHANFSYYDGHAETREIRSVLKRDFDFLN